MTRLDARPVSPEPNRKEAILPHQARLQRLRRVMQDQQVDAAFVSSPANVRYLSGFHGLEPEDREAFVLTTQTDARLFTSPLYPDQIDAARPVFAFNDIRQLASSLPQVAQETGIHTVGIEGNHLTVDEQDTLHAAGLETKKLPLTTLREIKDSTEIEAIRRACEAGDRVFANILPHLHEGTTEQEVVETMKQLMQQEGYNNEAFPTIVAFGPHTANPHYIPSDTKLTRGQFVLFDFGLVGKNGYPSDMTRTIFFGKEEDMTPEQRHMYETVREANQRVTDYLQGLPIEAFRDGQVTGKEVDAIARDFIYEAGYAPENFPHTLGHGLGLQVHESPSLSARSRDILHEGMVFTNEPGVYVDPIGGVRIEDDLVVTPHGVEVLTHAPRQLLFVKPSME